MSCGTGRRRGSDLVLLWLWRKPAPIAPVQPLAWEPPCAADAALRSKTKQKAKRNKKANAQGGRGTPTGEIVME